MSLPNSLRKLFGRSAEPDPLSGYAALGTKRMSVGQTGILADTGSMLPKYGRGDTFTVVTKPFETLNVGDIVIAWWEGKEFNVPHRIVGRAFAGNGELYYYTKGDNNVARDEHTLTRAEYVGLAVFTKDVTKGKGWV